MSMGQQRVITRSEEAEAVLREMQSATEVQRAVLEETLGSAESGSLTESGRTFCDSGRSTLPPMARFPKSVQLRSCPVAGGTGTIHTHVTQSELRNPEHSLPDWANVIFHGLDASGVIGTESAEWIVAAGDKAAMAEAFQEAIGVEVSRTDAVVGALQRGDIDDPPQARQRVRRALSPLVRRQSTGFTDLSGRVRNDSIPAYSPGYDALMAYALATQSPDVGGLREAARGFDRNLAMLIDRYDLDEKVISNALGIVVGSLVSRVLGL